MLRESRYLCILMVASGQKILSKCAAAILEETSKFMVGLMEAMIGIKISDIQIISGIQRSKGLISHRAYSPNTASSGTPAMSSVIELELGV